MVNRVNELDKAKAEFLEIYGLSSALNLGDVGGTLADASVLGELGTEEFKVGGSVSESDNIDVYRFEVLTPSNVRLQLSGLSADADLEVVQDFNGNGEVDSGEILGFSENFGVLPEEVDILLDSGTYFARVRQFEGQTDYELSINSVPFDLPADNAGNSLEDARVIDDLTNPQVLDDFVGGLDTSDYYRFTLDTDQEISVQLEGLSADADIELIRDANGDGVVQNDEVVSTSQRSGSESEAISADLEAATYFIHIYPFNGDTSYSLTVESADLPDDTVGNDLATALELGSFSGSQTLTEFLSPDDAADVYRFTLDTPSRLQADLTGLSSDADISLIQDVNENLEVDTNEVLTFSERVGTSTENINVILDAGTYFLNTSLFGDSRTGYSLNLNATPEALPVENAGDSLADAPEINLSGEVQVLDGFVGASDISDYYRFELSEAAEVSLLLDVQSPDADLLLVQDTNSDGVATSDETIAISERPGVADENITQSLEAGTYFLRVRQFRGDSPYSLSLSSTVNVPDPEPPTDTIGNTLADATPLDLSSPQTITESVSDPNDPADVFRVELAGGSNLRASLTGLTGDADLEVILDRNGNNSIDANEVLTFSEEFGLADEQVEALLGAGTYFLRVRPFESTGDYTLNVTAEAATLPTDGAGNTLGTARDIGSLSGAQSFTDFVGSADLFDVYRFSLEAQSQVALDLTGLSEDADLELIQDLNGNGTLDDGEKVAVSNSSSTFDEQIESVLNAGEYFIRVAQFTGDTDYQLTANAAVVETQPDDNAGNTLGAARNLGDLSSEERFSASDFVNSVDPLDYYSFNLSQTSRLEIQVTDLVGDVNLFLFADTNGDGEFTNPIETISASLNAGTANEVIDLTSLNPGSYFVLVEPVPGNETAYSIGFGAKTVDVAPDSPIVSDRQFFSGSGLVDAAAAIPQITSRSGRFNDVDYIRDGGGFADPGFNNLIDYGLNSVKAPEAWSRGFTGDGITVAVLDTGFDLKHFEFSGRLSDESTWRDFADDDNNPRPNFQVEDHGTHVAGTIVANRDSVGTTGVAYDAQFMPLRVIGNEPPEQFDLDVQAAIRHAVDNGAQVINMSFRSLQGGLGRDTAGEDSFIETSNGQEYAEAYRSVLEYAKNNGVVVVIAAGNQRDQFEVSKPQYPARFAEENLAVAVGATIYENEPQDSNAFVTSFSNPAGTTQGNFVSAPGQDIISAIPFENNFSNFQGTSMAAPHVSGVVALMMEAFYEAEGLDPSRDRLSPEQVDDFYLILNETASSEAIIGYIDEESQEEIRFE